ncbi:cysteine hydrolase family protein [Microvirga puerhi]|uniref:Cysteine hydrolase n=1 Tax=Microvirga puerhi TaxID=2876078 RepID=A0ABS7VLR8_9HYPH|nr:cysteine hydrolase family protein [Microvirga puerhi]MBZ6076473.1 cysteine hydrolase [Microvirga puerhi]
MTTALLVIDLQRGNFGLTDKPYAGDAVLSRSADLLVRARARGIPIFHVRHDGGAGDPLERGTPGWDIDSAVAPQDREPIIDKDRCSAFVGTDLHERLHSQSIDRLVIAGMQTEYCIDTTCRAARDLGYAVTLVSDGHTTFDTPELSGAQIVAHHNLTLQRGGFVDLFEAAQIIF